MDTEGPDEPLQPHPHPLYTEGVALGAEITELCGYLYAATYRLLVLIREFDEKGYWHGPGLCSCAHWLNFKCGIGMNAAREKVRVAHALKALPAISAAFARGEVSYSKVRAMTRIADAGNEEYLMMIARHGTAYHVETLVSKYRRCRRREETAAANAQYEHRTLRCRYDDDGAMVIETRLENLVQLCRFHHRLVHEGGFGCERLPDGRIVFRDCRDEYLSEAAVLPAVAADAEACAWIRARLVDLDIDEHTCTAKWYAGETIDWNLAVGHLFR